MSTQKKDRKKHDKNRSKSNTGDIAWLPDVPVLRGVTKRELQLFIVGLWPGVTLALLLAGQQWGAAGGLGMAVIERLRQDNDEQDASGIAGYIRDASSFVAGALAGFAVMVVLVTVFGVELTIPDLGVVA